MYKYMTFISSQDGASFIWLPCNVRKSFFLNILKINKHLQEHDLQKFVSCRRWSISLLAMYKNMVGIFHFNFHLGPELHKKERILRMCPVPPTQSRWQRCRTSDRSRSDWSRISTRGQAWYTVTYAVPCLSQTGASRPYILWRTYNIHINFLNAKKCNSRKQGTRLDIL
jgi:hypothetical protein